MITHGAVKESVNPPISKLVHARIVASWDWELPHSRRPINPDVDHAEAPLKLAHVVDIFFLGLGRQRSLAELPTALNFINLSHVH